ncbi:MAG: membrane protein insertion efficiency factor YidD [Flavobacteriia bacterium]|nr:membrane protein insertion efficiency factor YidD [Flavobacteriia bacterium]
MKNILISPLLFIIKVYQNFVSPLLPPSCRFQPSCSQYAKEVLIKYGLLKGSFLAVKRISKCHPWGGSGYDPIP